MKKTRELTPLVSSPAAAAAGDDLYYIKTSGTGQGMVEVHALSGASGYQEFIRHTVTVLAEGERDNGTFWIPGLGTATSGSVPTGRLNASILAAAQAYGDGAYGGQCAV